MVDDGINSISKNARLNMNGNLSNCRRLPKFKISRGKVLLGAALQRDSRRQGKEHDILGVHSPGNVQTKGGQWAKVGQAKKN
jgi:hypothetical protein